MRGEASGFTLCMSGDEDTGTASEKEKERMELCRWVSVGVAV